MHIHTTSLRFAHTNFHNFSYIFRIFYNFSEFFRNFLNISETNLNISEHFWTFLNISEHFWTFLNISEIFWNSWKPRKISDNFCKFPKTIKSIKNNKSIRNNKQFIFIQTVSDLHTQIFTTFQQFSTISRICQKLLDFFRHFRNFS